MTDQPQNRKKILLLSVMANYGAITVSILVGIVSIPLGLNYFGSTLYGIWLVIGSILAYLRMSDFGISLSTLTLMAHARDSSHQRVIMRRSIGLLLGISVVLLGIILVVAHLFPGWVGIFGKVSPHAQEEAAVAALLIGILTVVQLPTSVFAAAFSGLQQVHWNRAYGAFSSIVTLGALVATILMGGNLVMCALFTGVGVLLVGIVSGVHLFLVHPQLLPRFTERVSDAPSITFLLTSGIRFFALQIAVLIILNTDNLVISNFLGPEKVTPYAITFKLFFMCLMIVNTLSALWPMYGKSASQGEWDWIQRTYNSVTLPLMIAGGLVWIGGIIFSESIIKLWAGPTAWGGLGVVFALGGYVYLSSFTASSVNIANGLNPTNIVVVFGFIEAVLNLGISLALVKPLGIGGVALGTFIAALATSSWFYPLYIRHRTSKRVSLETKPIITNVFVVISCVIFALLTVMYLPEGWTQFVVGIAIILLYLKLSWRVMPPGIRNLIKDTLSGLLAKKVVAFR